MPTVPACQPGLVRRIPFNSTLGDTIDQPDGGYSVHRIFQ
jgi:hypothetical protein